MGLLHTRRKKQARMPVLGVLNSLNACPLVRELMLSTKKIIYIQTCQAKDDFYRASICEGGLGSRNSVCLSVRPSVTRCHTRGL